MRKILAVLLLLPAAQALAGYDKGLAAFARGDHTVAAREFRMAAEAGDPDCAYMLGRLYALGLGVKQDWVLAWKWQERALSQGVEEARGELETLEGVLTPAQLNEARLLAAGPQRPEQQAETTE